jgi:hypothetical protein
LAGAINEKGFDLPPPPPAVCYRNAEGQLGDGQGETLS